MEKTLSLSLRLTESHAGKLAELARRSHTDLGVYVQRMLQREADSELEKPDALRRTIAMAGCQVATAALELQAARRAYETGHGHDERLGLKLKQASDELTDTLTALAASVSG